MVSNRCQANFETLENKVDVKKMKLDIVVHVPVSYKSIHPYKHL